MEIVVKIKWDKPEEQNWLCNENIQTALSAYCKNTNFEVSEIDELTGSEALFGFCGWLTTKDEKTVMSASDDAENIAEKIKIFCDTNGLSEARNRYEQRLTQPE